MHNSIHKYNLLRFIELISQFSTPTILFRALIIMHITEALILTKITISYLFNAVINASAYSTDIVATSSASRFTIAF